jgi:hypothetical protein
MPYLLALCASVLGLLLIASAMPRHWRQLRGNAALGPRRAVVLRMAGASGLLLSLFICFSSDHPSMAALVWVMQLALAALVVAGLFACRTARP